MSAKVKRAKSDQVEIQVLPTPTVSQLEEALEERVVPDRRVNSEPAPSKGEDRRVRDRRETES